MKTKSGNKIEFFVMLMALVVVGGLLNACKKDTPVNIETFKIVRETERITAGTTTATITGTYDYSGTKSTASRCEWATTSSCSAPRASWLR